MTWKQATWTPAYPSATSADFTEVAVNELDGAEEILLFIGSSSTTTYQPVYMNTKCSADTVQVLTAQQFFGPSNTAYDAYVGYKYTKSTKKIGYRQTYKGTNAVWLGIREIWYR